MPDLSFRVDSAEMVPYSVAPTLAFKLRLTNLPPAEKVQAVVLRCQVRLEVNRRAYQHVEQERLEDLFGKPERWSQTLRGMLWTHANVMVPPFQDSIVVDLVVPCNFDFNVASTKYFAALGDGEAPLLLLFSGTVFYDGEEGGLQVTQIPWEKEATFRLPIRVWRDMMNHYYPNSAWLCLHKDVFDRLYRYKVGRGLPTWEQTLESLLPPERGGDKP
jgi:Family of unknown function (DUF6084)